MSLQSQTCFWCNQGFSQFNTQEASPGSASAGRTSWLGSAAGLNRVLPQRGLHVIPSFGLRWDTRRLVVTAATKNGGQGGREEKIDIRLDDADLMALEFGRLLGEPRQKTLSRVIQRKMNPEVTYIDLEKAARKGQKLSNSSIKSEPVNYQIQIDKTARTAIDDPSIQNASTGTADHPNLASPPVRPKTRLDNLSQAFQVESPSRFSAVKRPQLDTVEVIDESFLRKPSLDRKSTSGAAPAMPTGKATSPVFMRRKRQTLASEKESIADDDMLRRPSVTKSDKGSNESMDKLNVNSEDVNMYSNERAAVASLEDFQIRPVEDESLPPVASTVSQDSQAIQESISPSQKIPVESYSFVDDPPIPNASTRIADRPNLASPPVRPLNTRLSQASQVESPSRLSAVKRPQLDTVEGVDESFLRKPSLNQSFTGGGAPAMPTGKATSPVFMRRKRKTPASAKESIAADDLLRRPSVTKADKVRNESKNDLDANSEDVDMDSNGRAAVPCLEDFQIRPGEDESLQPVASPVSQGSQTIQESISPFKEMSDELYTEKPKPTLSEAVSRQLHVKDAFVTKEGPRPDLSESRFRQLTDRGTVSTGSEEKPQLMVEGSSLETESTLANGAYSDELQIKRSQPKPSNDLASPREWSSKEINAMEQSRVKNLDRTSVPPSRRPAKPATVHEEVAISSKNTGSMQDFSSEPEQTSVLEWPITSELSLEEIVRPTMESMPRSPIQLDNMDDPSFLQTDLSPLRPASAIQEAAPYSVVAGASKDSKVEEMKNLNFSRAENEAGLLIDQQAPVTSSEEHISKQQIKLFKRPTIARQSGQAKAVLNRVSQEPEDGGSAFEGPLSKSLDQVEALPTLKQPEYIGANLQSIQPRGLDTADAKWHQAKEDEDRDWARAEALLKSKEQEELKLVGNNSAGLFVSFGCVVGFLPLFELSPKRGLLDFPVWAQQKGFDVIRRSGFKNEGVNDSDRQDTAARQNGHEEGRLALATEEDLKDLRNKYSEEVTKLLSSFVGEKARVIVKSIDRNRRRLKFSEREADPGNQELVQKKADLMDKLNIGDIVTCEVKSITPIGVFVELHGVPALIHHSEISWNRAVDPTSLLSVGEVVEVRVCRLDRFLQRINLSLKQMQPDPLLETLESLVGDTETSTSLFESQGIDSEAVVWPELEALIRELEEMEEVACVSKGRRLRSAALAPTFQVFLSAPLDDGYKLLARFGNEIQEVLVKTTLDRERMKESIRVYTFKEL